MKKILVFASGSGSNFQSIIDSINRKDLNAEIVGLVVNKTGVKSIERAEKAEIPVFHISEKQYDSYTEYESELLNTCKKLNPNVIVLAGYMRKIPSSLIQAFENKILNIHPALLPKFGGKGMYGMHVHNAVIQANEKESGCTVHIVTEKFDEGPILDQAKVPVFPTDSPEILQKRVLVEEHKLYPKVLRSFLK